MADKVKSVIDDMNSRTFCDTVEDAGMFLEKCQTEYADFDSHKLVLNGIDTDGNFDPTVYTPSMRVMIDVLTNRGEQTVDAKGNKSRGPSTVRAIVVTPAPTIESILADPSGLKWLDKIVATQLSHVANAPLRKADNLAEAQLNMPLTLAEYVSPTREGSSASATYDALYRMLIDGFKRNKAWSRAKLVKAELKRCLESAAYALHVHPALEDRGDKPSLFVMACQVGAREAASDGLDPTIFNTWLETRNEATFEAEDESEDDDDFTIDDIVLTKPEAKAVDAAPVATPTDTADADDTDSDESEGDADSEDDTAEA